MSGRRPWPTWRDLNRRTVDPYWQDPAQMPRRHDLRPGDAERIAEAAHAALYAERHHGCDLVGALVACCKAQGWPEQHPLNVWTVAGWANLFPLYRGYGGRLVRASPDRALRYAYEDCFWGDEQLVTVAARRAALGWTGREPPEDYALRLSRLGPPRPPWQ